MRQERSILFVQERSQSSHMFPLWLPCYDFTSIKGPTLVSYIRPPITPLDHTQ